jgi:hypothetical protein
MYDELTEALEEVKQYLTMVEAATITIAVSAANARLQEAENKQRLDVAKIAEANEEARVKMDLLVSGQIDGKSADLRRVQLDAALADHPTLVAHRATVMASDTLAKGSAATVQLYHEVYKVMVEAVRREKNATASRD